MQHFKTTKRKVHDDSEDQNMYASKFLAHQNHDYW